MTLKSNMMYLDTESISVSDQQHNKIRAATDRCSTVDLMHRDFHFRTFANQEFPHLAQLARTVQQRLESDNPVVILRNLGLISQDTEVVKFLLLLLASCVGIPTQTNPLGGKVIWPITPLHDVPNGHKPTISETNNNAALHTDSTYRIMPERYVAMLCLKPAQDGGGETTLLLASSILAALRARVDGAKCEQLLRTKSFAYRVPDTFVANRNSREAETITVPVLATSPTIRYRYDSIVEGLQATGMEESREHAWALETIRQVIDACPFVTVALGKGDLILLNNHTALHGRTAFVDPSRLLLRVRMHAPGSRSAQDV